MIRFAQSQSKALKYIAYKCEPPVLYTGINKLKQTTKFTHNIIMRWTEADNMCISVNDGSSRKVYVYALKRLKKKSFAFQFTCSRKKRFFEAFIHSRIWWTSSLCLLMQFNAIISLSYCFRVCAFSGWCVANKRIIFKVDRENLQEQWP